MKYRRLGKSGVKVSEISLGSWLTYGGSVGEQTAIDCVHKAYELGVNSYVVKPVEFQDFMQAMAQIGLYWLLINEAPK